MSVKVKINPGQTFALAGALYEAGNVVEVSAAQANELEKAGIAKRVD